MHYNHISHQSTTRRPTQIRLNGIGYPNPSEEIYAAAGWVSVVPFVTPEGMANIDGTQSVVWDGTTATESWQTETLEAAQERQEAAGQAARHDAVLAMVDAYGTRVQALADLLAAIDIEIPTSKAAVQRALLQMPKGQRPTGLMGDFSAVYNGCREVMSDDDISAVWSIIKVTE